MTGSAESVGEPGIRVCAGNRRWHGCRAGHHILPQPVVENRLDFIQHSVVCINYGNDPVLGIAVPVFTKGGRQVLAFQHSTARSHVRDRDPGAQPLCHTNQATTRHLHADLRPVLLDLCRYHVCRPSQ